MLEVFRVERGEEHSDRTAQVGQPSPPASFGVVGKSGLNVPSERAGCSCVLEALASLSKISLVFIWLVGVTAGKRETTRCWCLNTRW